MISPFISPSCVSLFTPDVSYSKVRAACCTPFISVPQLGYQIGKEMSVKCRVARNCSHHTHERKTRGQKGTNSSARVSVVFDSHTPGALWGLRREHGRLQFYVSNLGSLNKGAGEKNR